jgi:hypothetical protein
VHGKRRNNHAYVHGYNPFSGTQCAVVSDTVAHVGVGEGNIGVA